MDVSRVFRAEFVQDVFVITLQQPVLHQSQVMDEARLVSDELSRSAPADVVVDLKGRTIGPVVLEALLQLWKAADAQSGRVALCGLCPAGREMIRVSHFDRIWMICETRAEALQAVAERNVERAVQPVQHHG